MHSTDCCLQRWLPLSPRGPSGHRRDSEDWSRLWRRHKEWSGAPRPGPPHRGPSLPSGKLLLLLSSTVLPTADDVCQIKKNLVVLVSRILCRYIKCLSSFSSAVLAHIPHAHSELMARKSETIVLDVVAKNEAKHGDMLDIMQILQGYLGEAFPAHQKVISGGDQLNCERQVCARRHMMDGNTPRDRLALLEPVCEDWHCLTCSLGVSYRFNACDVHMYICTCSVGYTQLNS